MFEFGIVKWFDCRAEKRNGFLLLEDGTEIFFHYNDGRMLKIVPVSYEVIFSDSAVLIMGNKRYHLPDPKPGDEVVFERGSNNMGSIASPWTYKFHYDSTVKHSKDLLEPPFYRALETVGKVGETTGEPAILWEGTDLQELLKKFPRPRNYQSISSDPLLPHWSDDDGVYETNHWFERKIGDTFIKCRDPRPTNQ